MAESVRISSRYFARAVTTVAVAMLGVIAPLALVGLSTPAGADGGGGTFTCTGTEFGTPVGYTVTMAAGSSGSALLGGTYIANCELTGTVPAGWGVSDTTNVTVDNGSENDGSWNIYTDDTTFTGGGTFTNAGTIDDTSPGFTQEVNVADFVNTGTLAAAQTSGQNQPDFDIAGPSSSSLFDNYGVVSAEAGGNIAVNYGTFRLEPGGSVAASPGAFTFGETSTLDIEGGTVTSGAIATNTFLGITAAAVEFGSAVPAGSTGTVQLNAGLTVSGAVPSGWTLAIDGGSPTFAPGSRNDGIITWNSDNSTLSDSGTFTNAGTFTDLSSGFSQSIAVADFVNTGTLTSDGPGLSVASGSSLDVFDNQGEVTVGSGDDLTVSLGTFKLDTGGTIAAGSGTFQLADHCTFEVSGGSVTSGVVSTVVTLGVGPGAITFDPGLPSGSTGTITLTSAITLNGTISSGWTVNADSGTLTAADGSGNDGTLVFNGSQAFNGSGSFTNNAPLTAESELFIDISAFSNGPTGSVSAVPGGYIVFTSGAPPTNLSRGVLTGGSWSTGALMDFNAPFTTDDATMTLTASTGVFATGTYLSFVFDAMNSLTTIDSGASLTLEGGRNETVSQGLVNNGALTLGPDDTLTVDGGLTEGSSSTLATGLDGTTFGKVATTGADLLSGTLALSVGGGYTPSPGDTQAVVAGSSVTGSFSSVTGPTQYPEGQLTVEYSAHAATVSLVSITLAKSATVSGYGAAGDVIGYQYQLTNDTETSLSGITVADNLIPTVDISCPASTLAAGAGETCTASYTVTQADVDGGSVTNTATASGTNPSSTVLSSPSSAVTVPASGATSSLSLVKSTTTSGYGAAGDTIAYQYAITNTGTTTVLDVGVNDSLIPSNDISCPTTTLAPGTGESCSASYTVDQADVDGGSVTNTAQATATNPHDTAIHSATSSVTLEANEATSTLSLSASTTTANYTAAGGTIDFSYLVTNTGTTTLSNVGVNDSLSVASDPSCEWDSLAPGASETCTGTYTVTPADMTAGSVTDNSQSWATNPQDVVVNSATSSVTVVEQAITTVTFLKSQAAPEVMVNGMNLGTRPQSEPACSAYNTDYANNALFIVDTSTGVGSGHPGDCIGLTIVSYTQSAVVFTFGNQYKNYPPLAAGDSYTVEVGNASASGTVVYDFPTIFKVAPSSGPGGGGTKVTVTGAGMLSPHAVLFGTVPATSFAASGTLGTTITAVAPPQSAGTVDITVTTSGGTSTTSPADRFTYLAPVVSSVMPASGSGGGGNKVSIAGKDLNKASAVDFGSVPATSFSVNATGTMATAIAPAQPAGTVDITVTSAGGTSALSSGDHYKYLAPMITVLKPTSGPGAGGNTVIISGHDLNGATSVLFGSTPAPSYTASAAGTSITAVAPPGSGGVYVSVTTPGGTTTNTALDRYRYLAPTITSVIPSTGPEAGSTTVTITGKDLNGASVLFGTAMATGVVVSPTGTSLTAVSPAESSVGPVLILVGPPTGAEVNITVTTPGGTAHTPFIYT